MISLRPYQDADFDSLLDVWERALPLDSITPEDFQRRVLLDPNREQDSLILALDEERGQLLGFALCLVLRQPIEKVGYMEHRGFITAMGVRPSRRKEGVGAKLLEGAEQFFRVRGRTEIAIAPYAPNYFVPGVDKLRYADGVSFLKKQGFEEYSEAIALDAMIGCFELSPEVLSREEELFQQGIEIHPLRRNQLAEFLVFMEENMPGDWVGDARRVLAEMIVGRATHDSIFIACDHNRIVGYCKFEGEHFGPFGMAESHQAKGIGSVLLARTLLQMRKEGTHAAYVLWTGERAANGIYKRLGFTISRRFAIMRKKLE